MKLSKICTTTFLAAIALLCGVSSTTASFVDKTSDLGLKLSSGQVAFVDYNNDGWTDIYTAGDTGTLWRNDQGKSFTKVLDKGSNSTCADYDNDGYPDIFCYENQQIFQNDAAKKFMPRPFLKLDPTKSSGACFADYNGDGFVDLYVGGYENWGEKKTYPDRLVFNRQGKSWEMAFSDARYRARGITACDFDKDGDVDIYVSNYRLQPNVLWRNNGTGSFVDVATSHNAIATWSPFKGGHSIGAAWGDFDNDGNIDLFAGNFAHDDSRGHQPHSFFLKNSGPSHDYVFKNMGQCGLHYQESYASPALADYDNDGDLDLYLTTVYAPASFGKENYPVLYTNDGNWKFRDVTQAQGLAKIGPTYQAAWADIDNDGDIDLVSDGKLFINQGNNNNWLRIKLIGDAKTINVDAIGSQVRIKLNNKTLSRQVEAGTGMGNQNELTLNFGLGNHPDPVDIEVFWAKALTQTIRKVKPNQLITVKFDKETTTTP